LFLACAFLLVAVHAAGNWTAICANCPSIMMGVSCQNASMCAFVGGNSDEPEHVVYSQDGFQTYQSAKMDADSFMLLDIALDKDGNGATAGLGVLKNGALLYTRDVTEWKDSTDLDFLDGQDMNAMGQGRFGFVGVTNQLANTQGVLVSSDDGKDWKAANWPANLSNLTEARYGSFPSPTTLYVTGGQWPSNSSLFRARHGPNCLPLSHKSCIKVSKSREQLVAARRLRQSSKDSSYFAIITKSSDGGVTWTVQYQDSGRFYMNDISCPTENTCYAAAEGFSDGSQPGARIFVTRDGGKTWVNNLVDTADDASLLRIHAVSETEAWAAGGHVEGGEAFGTFYHTTDGGKTWKLDGRVPYVGETSGLTFINSKLGYASGINEFQTATLMRYTA